MDIFLLHIKKRLKDKTVVGDFNLSKSVLEKLSVLTEGFVGAEIEYIVITALFEAFSEDRSITADDFEKAIRNTVPLSVTQAEQIRAIRDWANVRAVAATRQEDRAEYATDGEGKEKVDVRATRGGRTVDF